MEQRIRSEDEEILELQGQVASLKEDIRFLKDVLQHLKVQLEDIQRKR